MLILSFALVMGFYFWIGPIGLITLFRWLLAKRKINYAVLSFVLVASLSWAITALLTYCVSHWSPGTLQDEVIKTAFLFGWSYLFVTSIPAMALFGLSILLKCTSKNRLFWGYALASTPYILMLIWGVLHL